MFGHLRIAEVKVALNFLNNKTSKAVHFAILEVSLWFFNRFISCIFVDSDGFEVTFVGHGGKVCPCLETEFLELVEPEVVSDEGHLLRTSFS